MPFLPWLLVAWSFVKEHWRSFVLAGALCAAFVGGRCSVQKASTERSMQAITQTTTKVETQVEQKTVEKKDEQRTVTRDVDTVRHARDGSTAETREHVVEQSGTEEQTQTTSDVHEQAAQVTTQTVKQTEKIRQAALPSWFVGANLGVPVGLQAPFLGTPFVILHVDRRVLGPVSVGVWGSISVKGQNPALGVAVGVTF